MIKGVIFDMDGLLVDSERLTYRLIKQELNTQGLDMSEAFYTRLLGRTYDTAHALFLDEYGNDFDDLSLTKLTNSRLIDCYKKGEIDVKEGVVEFLEFLKSKQIKTIVATSSPHSTATLCLTGAKIIDYFDDMICGDEVTVGKPNPEIFLKAAKKIHFNKDEVMIFEDSEAGIQAAYNADMKVICIPDMKYPNPDFKQLTYLTLDTINQAIPYID